MPDGYDPERTLGPHVAAISALAGFPPDPEQRMLLDLAFALDKNGKSLAFEVVVIAPRQNLKTGFLKQYALGQLFVRNETLVPWSAHEFPTASEAVNDIESLIDSSDLLRARVALTTRGKVAKRGAVPEIRLTSGARMIFKTRTAGGGRGLSGRKTMLDEAYALQPGQIGALLPIMLAQPDPQVVAASSACRPESVVLWDMVQRGRRGGSQRMVYAEWCAPPPEESCAQGVHCTHGREIAGCGCDKPDLLVRTHSAVTRGRILIQTLVDARGTLPPEEYAREIMGWHDEVIGGAIVLGLAKWPDLVDVNAAMTEPAAFAVAVSPDRQWASIGVAGPAVGRVGVTHLELIERRPGVDWLVGRCVELRGKHKRVPWVIDDHGPAASLIPDLQKKRLTVVATKASELADATEKFLDGVRAEQYVHGPDATVDDAIAGVKPRPMGDRFVFGRKASEVDITALEVLALAAYGAATYKRKSYVVDTQALLMEAARAEEDVADPEDP